MRHANGTGWLAIFTGTETLIGRTVDVDDWDEARLSLRATQPDPFQAFADRTAVVLRALGGGLPEIGRILSEQVDEVDALRGHHRRLLEERDRLDALAGTVSRTIAPGLAAYQRDAIEAYAATLLS